MKQTKKQRKTIIIAFIVVAILTVILLVYTYPNFNLSPAVIQHPISVNQPPCFYDGTCPPLPIPTPVTTTNIDTPVLEPNPIAFAIAFVGLLGLGLFIKKVKK
ncbi:MAG: hypothetical protein OIN86_13045 [Candidatus Methanoperedens sp.]|nr:hypothetical protein [Candidatus Methanoperedens sp.]CAG0948884.1 hypothetical protein METP1_00064 [Methanosarcinales archaeon]